MKLKEEMHESFGCYVFFTRMCLGILNKHATMKHKFLNVHVEYYEKLSGASISCRFLRRCPPSSNAPQEMASKDN